MLEPRNAEETDEEDDDYKDWLFRIQVSVSESVTRTGMSSHQ